MPVTSKVALVIDALPAIGGAEKVVMAVMELFPDAPIYTLIYHSEAFVGTPIAERQVFTSYLDRLPQAHKQYRKFLPLMPHAIEHFDIGNYDQIISFSYAVAHGISTQPGQRHLSYTFTPMRYAWRPECWSSKKKSSDRLLAGLLYPFRKWDTSAVIRVGQIASVSRWIQDIVQCVYHRDSTVIYPPVDVERFIPQVEREGYYITVARLVGHKRIGLIVDAFNQLQLPLLVVGEGPERARLEHRARPNIRFMGFQPDEVVASLLSRARGYLCASEEDFGISMVEAQAAGCPVIAYGRGGALETISEGETGLFFQEQTSANVVDSVLRCESQITDFNPLQISDHAQCYQKRRFLEEFSVFVEK
jgi:glycosyltransferase involved in cell wall biosynthesis